MTTFIADITAKDWQVKVGAYGDIVTGAADIGQCITLILLTPLGADPLRPLFGSDLRRYRDYPIDRAVPHLVRESVDALEAWEPRIEIIRVEPRLGVQLGQVVIRVVWRLANSNGAEQVTLVFL